MKVSIAWLKKFVEIANSTEEIADILTMAGLEVEEIAPAAPPFRGVKVAEVIEVSDHPDAAKLKVCMVNIGSDTPLQIVCGASNVAVGLRVPCATVGASLPGMEIRAARLRGVESNGMLCSARELGLSADHEGLLVLPEDAPIGADYREYGECDDVVLTLKITPNRGDCLSIVGVARELAAAASQSLEIDGSESAAATGDHLREISIAAPFACGHYVGRVIDNLNPRATTPEWLKNRIERAGLRPISPIVDITNYVMIERGQPMHAFDNSKLAGAILVRFAKPTEKLHLLNGVEADLTPEMLLICDQAGPIAVGGVMGGHDSMYTGETTSVFFEAAWFSPSAVRGTAAALGVSSDAAYRFERGVDPEMAIPAIEQATRLCVQICGTANTRVGPLSIAKGELPQRQQVRVRPTRVESLIGMHIPVALQVDALIRVGCGVATEREFMLVKPPNHRFDLAIEEDFIEEIARIFGYQNIPDRAPISSLQMLKAPEGVRRHMHFRNAMASFGYSESICFSFVDPAWESDFAGNLNPVKVRNPIASHLSVMRSTLIGGLVAALKHNLLHGETRVRLFELGRCFLGESAALESQPERLAGIAYGARYPEQWGEGGQKGRLADFFDVKGDIERLFGGTKIDCSSIVHPALHPGRSAKICKDGKSVGVLGELHPQWTFKYGFRQAPVIFELDLKSLESTSPPAFTEFSRMQAIRRDVAICIDENHQVASLIRAVKLRNFAGLRDFSVFDLYRGSGLPAGQKSVAFRVVMQDTDRTLTDIEADALVSEIVKVLVNEFGATLRK
jgi:phenylalanyl-tRNA synthetase beta chain